MHWQILNLDIICSNKKTALLYLFCFHSLKRKIIFALAAQNKKETLVLFIWTLQFESISSSACTAECKPLVLFIDGIKCAGSLCKILLQIAGVFTGVFTVRMFCSSGFLSLKVFYCLPNLDWRKNTICPLQYSLHRGSYINTKI